MSRCVDALQFIHFKREKEGKPVNHSPTTTCPQGDLGHEMSSLLSLPRDVLSDVRPAPPRQPPGVARMLPSDTPSCTPLRGICCWVFFKLGGGAGQGQSYQRRMPGRGAGGQEGQHKLSGAGNGKQKGCRVPREPRARLLPLSAARRRGADRALPASQLSSLSSVK